MRLLLVGNYPPDGQESMQRFSSMLRQHLLAAGVEVSLVRPSSFLIRLAGDRANPYGGLAKWFGYLDKFILFPPVFWWRARRHEVVHICDHSNAMYGRWTAGRPWLLTCNDLLAVRSALGEFSENRTQWSGKLLQKWILAWVTRAPRVACISSATRNDVLRLTSQSPERVDIVHMGLNHPYRRRPESEWRPVQSLLLRRHRILADTRFVFHVGGNQWYKNRSGVIALFSAIAGEVSDLHLVIAGQPSTAPLVQQVERAGLASRVHWLGAVSNEELEALYHAAEFLLFPSLAEGFGWPVVEAQICGCRVAAANRAPLPEVGGESCVYLDLDNAERSKTQLLALLNEPAPAREARIQDGLENVKRFDPRLMAERYLELYERLTKDYRTTDDGTTEAE